MKRPEGWLRLLVIVSLLAASWASLNLNPIKMAQASASAGQPASAALSSGGVQLLQANDLGDVLELSTPDETVQTLQEDHSTCQLLSVPGYSSLQVPGSPELPVTGVMLAIPANGDIEIEVDPALSEIVSMAGQLPVCPAQTASLPLDPGQLPAEVQVTRVAKAASYVKNSWFPAQPVEIVTEGNIRSQRVAQLRLQPYQYNPVSGELRVYRRLSFKVSFQSSTLQPTPVQHYNIINEGYFEPVLRQVLINYDQGLAWRSQPVVAIPSIPVEVPQAGPSYKITVNQAGIYRVTYTELQQAGIPVDSLDPRTFRLFNMGIEVAIQVEGEADGRFDPTDALTFYGEPVNTPYTTDNVYWLTWGGADGLRMQALDGIPNGGVIPASYRMTQHIEQDILYEAPYASNPGDDHWYWGSIFASSGPAFEDFTATLDGVAASSSMATVRGLLKGVSAIPNHHTRIYLNNHLIDDSSWPSSADYSFEVQVPQSYLVSGSNTFRVECPLDDGTIQDIVLVNWFEIDYDHAYKAEDGQLFFGGDQPGDWQYQVDGFNTDQAAVYDITLPLQPQVVQGFQLTPGGSTYQLTFQQAIGSERHYIALDPARLLSPLSIQTDTPSDLKDPANQADYLVIAPASFIPAIQPLVDYHRSQGFQVKVVDVQDIYDEFNGGVFSPLAIHDFLAYAYANWRSPAPSFVLLVGDGNFDFKNNLGRNAPNYIPPYLGEVDPWLGETASDNRYVTVAGDDFLPDMAIGRFPVRTPEEAALMANRVIAYEQQPITGGWNRRISLVADNGDSSNNFAAASDQLANELIPSNDQVDKIYYNLNYLTVAAARQAILDAINQGRLLVSYFGHAGTQYWSAEELLSVTDLAQLTNQDRFPIMVPMTCLDGYFIWPSPPGQDYSSLGESIVRQPNGGAIASWSPTGYGEEEGHSLLDEEFFQALFVTGTRLLGVATTQAKLKMFAQTSNYQSLIDTYVLFGDPALEVPVPANIYLPLVLK